MDKFDLLRAYIKIQYPTVDPQSLQRSITQIKALLEDERFYQALADNSANGSRVQYLLNEVRELRAEIEAIKAALP